MKYFRTITFLVLFFLCCSGTVSGTEGVLEEDAWDKKQIKVGYFDQSVLIKNLNSIENKGFGYDLIRASEKYHGFSFEFIPVTYDTLEASLEAGVIDVFGGMNWTQEREEKYIFSEPFAFSQILLVASEDSEMLYDDFLRMNGEKVTVLAGFEQEYLLNQYLEQHEITLEIDIVNNLRSFYRSENTLHLTTDFLELADKKVVANLGTENIYFVAKQGNDWCIEVMNQIFAVLDRSEPWVRGEIYEKYTKNSMAKQVFTVEQMELLQSKKTYTVGYASNLYPLEGKDENGNPQGIMVQLLDFIAEKGGISLNYVPFALGEKVDYSFFDLSIVYAGDEAYLSEFTMTNQIPGSPPLVLVAKDGLIDLKNEVKSVGMLSYCTFDFDVVHQKFPYSDLLIYYTYEDMMKDLQQGKLDGLLVSNITSGYLLLELEDYVSYHTSLFLPLRLFISKEIPEEFVDIFNILLGEIQDDLVSMLMLRQVSEFYVPLTFHELLVEYWYLYAAAVMGICFSIVAFVLAEQKKKQEEFLNAVNVDDVTGLMSEVKFIREVALRLQDTGGQKYRMMSLDIDQFTLINRQYGNRFGNLILKKIGSNLMEHFPEQSLICRSRDDLFYIFAPVSSELRALCGKAFCDQCLVQSASSILLMQYPLSISRGTYLVEDNDTDVDFMLEAANMARKLGKNTYGMTHFEYTTALDEKRVLNEGILSNMEEALRNRALRVHFQVKVDTNQGRITGAEALVRWFHLDEENEPMSIRYMPEDFIALFEENGFITKMDYYVLNEVCRFIAKNRGNPYMVKIAMNLSGITLLRSDLFSMLEETLQRHKVFPQEIDIEITESAFTNYPEEAAKQVKKLGELGYTIAMDDFGTGASSLNRLKDMEIHMLKLDKTFLDYNLTQGKGSIIVGNIIEMAKKIKVLVVAEGVETQDQVTALRELRCDQVQGFFYSKPLCEEDFLEICREEICYSQERRDFLMRTNRYGVQKNLRP